MALRPPRSGRPVKSATPGGAVKKGDVVLYGKWSGTEVKMDGKDYVILKESDILGVEG